MMNNRVVVLAGSLFVCAAALGSADAAEVAVEGVLKPDPVGSFTCIAAEFDVGAGVPVTEIRWFNNDNTATFPSVILLEGQAGRGPDLDDAGLILANVAGGEMSWGGVVLDSPVASSTGTIYVVFVLPDGGDVMENGQGGGASVGYLRDASAPAGYVSADGHDWVALSSEYGIAAELVSGMARGPVASLAGMRGALGSGWGDANETIVRNAPAIRSELFEPWPNPFNPQVSIQFALARQAKATVVVYDVQGRRVRTLLAEERSAGRHVVVWDGTDGRGTRVASGVYHIQFKGADALETKRVVLLK